MNPSTSEKCGDERKVDEEAESEYKREEERHGTEEGKHKTEEGRYKMEEGRYESEESETPPPPPPHPSLARATGTPPMSNQQGHVTALKNDKCELAPANEGAPKPHIKYPICTRRHPPLSWSAVGNETAIPEYIVNSRPLCPQPKRRHRKKYAERRPFPTLPTAHSPAPFATHLDAGSALAVAQAPAPSFATGKSGTESGADESKEHCNNNIGTAPYHTTRSRPPPWPIKHTPASTSPTAIPHPLPQLHTKIPPALSIANSRPPPWPNKF